MADGSVYTTAVSRLHKLHCPYCRYHWLHTTAEWNALSQDQRTAIVAKRTCKN